MIAFWNTAYFGAQVGYKKALLASHVYVHTLIPIKKTVAVSFGIDLENKYIDIFEPLFGFTCRSTSRPLSLGSNNNVQ